MISKSNPQNRKMTFLIAALVVWMLLLISPIGHLVAVVTIAGWIIIFFMLGMMRVRRPPDK